MEDGRLLEIMSIIDKYDGPLEVIGFVDSLDEVEKEEIFKMIAPNKYSNFYVGIKAIASEYMKDKQPLSDEEMFKKTGFSGVYKGDKVSKPMFDDKYAEMLLCSNYFEEEDTAKRRK